MRCNRRKKAEFQVSYVWYSELLCFSSCNRLDISGQVGQD